jgi:lipid-A-disaccharide synthase
MIIAGEASGDLHGANLVQAMQNLHPRLFFFGIGGRALRRVGVRTVIDGEELAVVGITEVFSKIPFIKKSLALTHTMLRELQPDLLILIDFPDYNLRVAKLAKQLGIPILYYISPQIWAWRPGRVKKIGRLVDHMAVILPFEVDFYRKHDIPVTFVGHPLLDTSINSSEAPKSETKKETLTIGLLPGSRSKEVKRHLEPLLQAAHRLAGRHRQLRFLLSAAPSVDFELFEQPLQQLEGRIPLIIVRDSDSGASQVIKSSDLVVAASGTATLETALAAKPMVIIYKVSPTSYLLGRLLVRVKHVGLINLIAERKLVPELLQAEVTPSKIADQVSEMIQSPARLEDIAKELKLACRKLGQPGASERTARLALSLLAVAR